MSRAYSTTLQAVNQIKNTVQNLPGIRANSMAVYDELKNLLIDDDIIYLTSGVKLGLRFENNLDDYATFKTALSNSGTFDAAVKYFGDYSIRYASSSSQYSSWDDSEDWDVGSGEFYYDFFMRRNTAGVAQNVTGQGNTAALATISHYVAFLSAANTITFGTAVGSTGYTVVSTDTIGAGAWTHIRCGRDGNTLRLFVDGVQQGTGTAIAGTINNVAYPFSIGRIGNTNNTYFDGWIDEFQFVKGKSPGSVDFTPPAYNSLVGAGYVRKEFSTIKLDRAAFPRIYEPSNATARIDVLGELVRDNTLQAATSTTLTLDTGASAVDDFYNGNLIILNNGAGAGQARVVQDYDGTTKVATVTALTEAADSTTDFEIYEVMESGITPAYDFNNINYVDYPNIQLFAYIEMFTGALQRPLISLPTAFEYGSSIKVTSGSGTGTLSAGLSTVNITLDEPVNLDKTYVIANARGNTSVAYIVQVVPELTSQTNLELTFSGNNATAPYAYSFQILEVF